MEGQTCACTDGHRLYPTCRILPRFILWSVINSICITDEGLWDILIKDIPKEVTSHTFSMDILKQGVSYDFRVIGVNDYGYGSPSLPSPSISGELFTYINYMNY